MLHAKHVLNIMKQRCVIPLLLSKCSYMHNLGVTLLSLPKTSLWFHKILFHVEVTLARKCVLKKKNPFQ